MELIDKIRMLIEVFRVANDDVIGNVARQIFNLNWKEGLSARNQAHKILDELAITNTIQKGKGFYSINEYRGEYKEHDRTVTKCIAQLVLAKLPISIYREVSFPVGLRSDAVGLIGKDGKAICFVLEVANTEEQEYLNKKAVIWKNWTGATDALSDLFKTPIPYFTLVVSGKSHPDMMDFNDFMEVLK